MSESVCPNGRHIALHVSPTHSILRHAFLHPRPRVLIFLPAHKTHPSPTPFGSALLRQSSSLPPRVHQASVKHLPNSHRQRSRRRRARLRSQALGALGGLHPAQLELEQLQGTAGQRSGSLQASSALNRRGTWLVDRPIAPTAPAARMSLGVCLRDNPLGALVVSLVSLRLCTWLDFQRWRGKMVDVSGTCPIARHRIHHLRISDLPSAASSCLAMVGFPRILPPGPMLCPSLSLSASCMPLSDSGVHVVGLPRKKPIEEGHLTWTRSRGSVVSSCPSFPSAARSCKWTPIWQLPEALWPGGLCWGGARCCGRCWAGTTPLQRP